MVTTNDVQPKKLRAIVARGRTVTAPHPTKMRVVGYHPDTGVPLKQAVEMAYGPGTEIELPQDEIDALRSRGFLTDPSQVLQPYAEGPHYTETGAQSNVVKAAAV